MRLLQPTPQKQLWIERMAEAQNRPIHRIEFDN